MITTTSLRNTLLPAIPPLHNLAIITHPVHALSTLTSLRTYGRGWGSWLLIHINHFARMSDMRYFATPMLAWISYRHQNIGAGSTCCNSYIVTLLLHSMDQSGLRWPIMAPLLNVQRNVSFKSDIQNLYLHHQGLLNGSWSKYPTPWQ